MAAATTTFDTFEVLEMILYKLPTKDLLFSQRVCKQWKEVIDNSSILQEALFFKPLRGNSIPFGASPTSYESAIRSTAETEEFNSNKCLVNPLLGEIFSVMTMIDGDDQYHDGRVPLSSLSESIRWLAKPYNYPHASWKRMMPTQPPVENSFYIDHLQQLMSFRLDLAVQKTFSDGSWYMGEITEQLDVGLAEYENDSGMIAVLRRAAPLLYGIGFKKNDTARCSRLIREHQAQQKM